MGYGGGVGGGDGGERVVLCLPCYCSSLDGSGESWLVYMLDLLGAGGSPPTPKLRIDFERLDVYSGVVFQSKLYMFQSANNPDALGSRTAVPTVDLSNHYNNIGVVELEEEMVIYAPSLLNPKRHPVAVPTPKGDGLLVFSSRISFFPPLVDFELYSPATGCWQQLPGVYDDWEEARRYRSFGIQTFAFLTQSIFFIETKMGMFQLDVYSPQGGWLALPNLAGSTKVPFRGNHSFYFTVVDAGLCFSPFCAFDIDTIPAGAGISVCSEPPRMVFVGDHYESLSLSFGLVPSSNSSSTGMEDGDGGFCYFCIVQTAIDRKTEYPHLAVDVYRSDVLKYREDKQRLVVEYHLLDVEYKEDMRRVNAKYKEDKHRLAVNEEDKKKSKAGRNEEKEKRRARYREEKGDLLLRAKTLQLVTTVDKSFRFVLHTEKSHSFYPIGLFFFPVDSGGGLRSVKKRRRSKLC